jgi:hypothetical protein
VVLRDAFGRRPAGPHWSPSHKPGQFRLAVRRLGRGRGEVRLPSAFAEYASSGSRAIVPQRVESPASRAPSACKFP